MKTTKIAMVIALFAFATLGFSHPTKKEVLSVKISLSCATQNLGLVMAMYQQIDPNFLKNEHKSHIYTAKVWFQQTKYYVTGNLKEWKLFFMRDIHDYAQPSNPIPEE